MDISSNLFRTDYNNNIVNIKIHYLLSCKFVTLGAVTACPVINV